MISFGTQFKEDVRQGILKASDAICSTYGPDGNVVFVKSIHGGSKFTKDGYSVAITLDDINNNNCSAEDIGIRMVTECSKRINQICGDSTTTVVVLFRELINQIRVLNLKPSEIKEFCSRMDSEVEKVCKYLESSTDLIDSVDKLKTIARTSANDTELGDLIADLIWKVKYNKVKIEQSLDGSNSTIIVDGIQFDVNTPSYLLRNHLSNPKVFITTRTFTTWEDISLVINKALEDQCKDILIICEDIVPTVTQVLERYQETGQLNVSIIRAPFTNKEKQDFVKDLAKIFNTKLNTYATEFAEFVNEVELGTATDISFSAGVNENIIYIIPSDEVNIDAIVEEIKAEPAVTEYEKYCKELRLSVIESNIGVLRLYANSESEYKEIKDRVDDCINSCKNSLKYGRSLGGGDAYKNASEHTDFKPLKESLLAPYRILGGTNGEVFDSTYSLVNCVKVATSVLKSYLKLDYAVVNKTESLI